MAGQVECSFCGGVWRCQVDFIPRSGSRSSTQIDWRRDICWVEKGKPGFSFSGNHFRNGFRGMHLGSHNQFHVKLIREIDDFVECLARAFDFLWFIDFITTSKCKVLRTELLSAWFSEFFEKRWIVGNTKFHKIYFIFKQKILHKIRCLDQRNS